MIEFIIYIIGVGVMITGIYYANEDEDVTIGKAISMVFLTLFSWLSLAILVVLFLIDNTDFGKVIYHGKKKRYISPNEIEDMENLIERTKEKYGNSEVSLPEKFLILDDRGPMGSGGVAYLTKIRINDDKPEYYLDFWGEGWKSSDELIEQFSAIINEDKLRKILMSVCLEVDEFDSRLNQLIKDFSYLPQEDVTECLSFYLEVIKKKTQKKGISKLSFGSAIREYLNTIGVTESKFKVITLCGSTRFKKQFLEAQKRLTLEGCIVLSVGLFGHSGDEEVWQPGMKEMLDDMHLQKIDMADEIFVINVGGYIGESTKREIAHAEQSGKSVRYLESI